MSNNCSYCDMDFSKSLGPFLQNHQKFNCPLIPRRRKQKVDSEIGWRVLEVAYIRYTLFNIIQCKLYTTTFNMAEYNLNFLSSDNLNKSYLFLNDLFIKKKSILSTFNGCLDVKYIKILSHIFGYNLIKFDQDNFKKFDSLKSKLFDELFDVESKYNTKKSDNIISHLHFKSCNKKNICILLSLKNVNYHPFMFALENFVSKNVNSNIIILLHYKYFNTKHRYVLNCSKSEQKQIINILFPEINLKTKKYLNILFNQTILLGNFLYEIFDFDFTNNKFRQKEINIKLIKNLIYSKNSLLTQKLNSLSDINIIILGLILANENNKKNSTLNGINCQLSSIYNKPQTTVLKNINRLENIGLIICSNTKINKKCLHKNNHQCLCYQPILCKCHSCHSCKFKISDKISFSFLLLHLEENKQWIEIKKTQHKFYKLIR